jgi:hypothetical protein
MRSVKGGALPPFRSPQCECMSPKRQGEETQTTQNGVNTRMTQFFHRIRSVCSLQKEYEEKRIASKSRDLLLPCAFYVQLTVTVAS